ncbi:MAG: tetratricopeptide repeat protein, partial [Gammaproteobacteria bacterium]|nr:tetratricopeptide repeat protein [Gammaproteobacteria bacterium]
MSLLMDALRKAEEEKRRAALEKKGEEGTAGAGAPDQLASTFPPEPPAPEVASQTGEHTAENLRLEPIEGAAAEPASTTAPGSRTTTGETPEPFGDTTKMRLTAAQRDVFDALGVPRRNEATGAFEGEQDFDATLPSKRMLKRSLEEYFEPTRSLESARVTSAPEEPAAPVGADSGPITAQTVFSAKRRVRSSSAFSAAASLLLLAAAGLGAVGAYYWYTQSRSTQLVPPPAVAQRVEAIQTPVVEVPPVPVAPPAETAGEAGAVEPAATTTTAATTEPTAPVTPAEPTPQPPAEGVAAVEPIPAAPTPPAAPAAEPVAAPAASPTVAPAPAAPLAEVTPPAATPAEEAAPAAPAPAAAIQPQPPVQTAMVEPPSTVEVERLQAAPAAKPKSELPAPKVSSAIDGSVMPGEIRIARARATQPFVPGQVQEAYDAYQRGDYGRAETLYRTALARYPGNRDALLGIAALSWRSGDRAGAAAIYQRLLQANPNDATARSALLTLQKDKNPVADESTVKLLLHREPESAQLRFVLGNIYARQQRWPEAQQAYFDAFTRDKSNPDVAYNLAVSLDNLGQRAAALDHYRRAVELARQRPARFAPADAQSRIQALALV